MRSIITTAGLGALVLAVPGLVRTPEQRAAPTFERVYPLKPEEGVFAYARISPDGRYLAYASEMPDPERRGAITQTVTVADLRTKRVLFTEPGIDAYWSNDGTRMIYLGRAGGRGSVTVRDHRTGEISREVAPAALGDYYSWARRDGKDLILTINSNYYYLDGNRAVLPHGSVPPCEGIGAGERPLISKDGRRITTFVRGTIVVRNLTDCADIFDTGIRGAKADFSFDGRYIAFHAPKTSGRGYDIQVVDLEQRTVRTVTNLRGSSYFPSWTRDGRLNFRYDGDEYRGFMTASNVLSVAARPLPDGSARASSALPAVRRWGDLFPETTPPAQRTALVLVWSTWSAHSPMALAALEEARRYFSERSLPVAVTTATEPGSRADDIARLIATHDVRLPRIPLAAERLPLTEAHNQIPTTLLFHDGRLIDRRLGAQTFEELRDWVVEVGAGK